MGKAFKTEWEYILENEALRIIEIAYLIATGFYLGKNFPVLPYPGKPVGHSTVLFPKLNYSTIPRFWSKVQKINYNATPIKADKKLIREVENLLEEQNLHTPKIKQIKTEWQKASDAIISEINRLIPGTQNAVTKITVYPTRFGTSTTFSVPRQFPSEIKIFLREDQNLWSLCEALLTALTRHTVREKLRGGWRDSELLVDWLLTESSLNKIITKHTKLPNPILTIKQTNKKQNARLLQKSEEFLRKIGAPAQKNAFTQKNSRIFYNQKPLRGLTAREKQILNLLIKNSPKPATTEELADIIFKNENDFSLYVISKTIQRLRDKLESQNIPATSIQTLRTRGYSLIPN